MSTISTRPSMDFSATTIEKGSFASQKELNTNRSLREEIQCPLPTSVVSNIHVLGNLTTNLTSAPPLKNASTNSVPETTEDAFADFPQEAVFSPAGAIESVKKSRMTWGTHQTPPCKKDL